MAVSINLEVHLARVLRIRTLLIGLHIKDVRAPDFWKLRCEK